MQQPYPRRLRSFSKLSTNKVWLFVIWKQTKLPKRILMLLWPPCCLSRFSYCYDDNRIVDSVDGAFRHNIRLWRVKMFQLLVPHVQRNQRPLRLQKRLRSPRRRLSRRISQLQRSRPMLLLTIKRLKRCHVLLQSHVSCVVQHCRLGMEVSREQDLAEWYSQVITKSDMIEYYVVCVYNSFVFS